MRLPPQRPTGMHLGFGKLPQTTAVVVLLVAVTVLVADWSCIELTKHSGRIAAIWLSNGIVVVILLRSATRTWWAVLAASFLANVSADLLSGDALSRAAMLSLANAIEAILVAYPLRRFELDRDIRSVRAVSVLLILALGPAVLIPALLAVLVLSTSDLTGFLTHFFNWYAADALGLVLVVPIGAYIRLPEFQSLFNAENRIATLTGFALILAAFCVAFALPQYPLKYLLIPPILYLSFQSDYAGAVLGMTLVGLVLLTALAFGIDVVSNSNAAPRESILFLQIFLIVLNTTALSASAQLRKRRLLEQKLKTATRQALLAQEAAVEAQQTAESANRTKSQFLSNMSHELRTPLNAILGFSSLMRGGDLSKSLAIEYASDIHDAGSHLLDLITDVLDISKIEAGKRQLELNCLDLREPVGEAVTMTRKMSDAKRIMLTADVPDHSLDVVADRRAIKQIALNLLSNAVKFTPEGGEIFVSLTETTEGASLTVRDTGIGIPADFLPRVGNPFEQANASSSRDHQGTGLGLALVKSLTQLHGGRFSINSTEHVGTTASVFFPRTAPVRAVA